MTWTETLNRNREARRARRDAFAAAALTGLLASGWPTHDTDEARHDARRRSLATRAWAIADAMLCLEPEGIPIRERTVEGEA